MSRLFVVKAEAVAVVPDLIITAFDTDECAGPGFGCQLGRVAFAVNGKQRVDTEGVFEVRYEKFLMLLFVVEAERDERCQVRTACVSGRPARLPHVLAAP